MDSKQQRSLLGFHLVRFHNDSDADDTLTSEMVADKYGKRNA